MDDCYLDLDGDRIHDDADQDDDGDGIDDVHDYCPRGLMGWSSTASNDFDSDGCNDSEEDDDDDNDGFPDSDDALPLNFNEWIDSDMDGIGDNSDTDDDNDGLSDADEATAGSNRLDPDSDDDNFEDGVDAFPTDPTEWSDADGDGYGDNGDAFPNDAERHLEADNTAMYAFIGSALVVISLVGLGGWMVMRRRKTIEPVNESIQTEDAEFVEEVTPGPVEMEKTVQYAREAYEEPEPNPEATPEPSKISAPDDARMNEHGQLVWVELSGEVYCQNPDGSVMSFDPMTGTWKPFNQ